MFFVVEFRNGSVEVIPDNWMLEDGKVCYWPPSRGMKVMHDIKEKRVPERSWRKVEIAKVRRKCGKSHT